MTGFGQSAGTAEPGARWNWEIRTVNAKGLDLRLRLPPGFDALDAEVRRRLTTGLARGTCHATLGLTRPARAPTVRLDTDRLDALLRALADVSLPPGVGPVTLDGLIALRGVVETAEEAPDPAGDAALADACLRGLDAALASLLAMRAGEGEVLARVLAERLAAIARLTRAADEAPQRRPEAARAKLEAAVAALAGGRFALDPDRLHQEALLLAAKADVREELDRLAAHVAAAQALMAGGGPVGRRLDFLAQELGREASTFCAKVDDAALTAIGLELRVEIEQFREQVQNLE